MGCLVGVENEGDKELDHLQQTVGRHIYRGRESAQESRVEGIDLTFVHRVDVPDASAPRAVSMVVSINVPRQLPVVFGIYRRA